MEENTEHVEKTENEEIELKNEKVILEKTNLF
jgi:hypothetical protein